MRRARRVLPLLLVQRQLLLQQQRPKSAVGARGDSRADVQLRAAGLGWCVGRIALTATLPRTVCCAWGDEGRQNAFCFLTGKFTA